MSKFNDVMALAKSRYKKPRLKKIQQPEKWDKIWRLVVLDFDGGKAKIKKIIEKSLSKLNFVCLCENIFVTPYDCSEPVTELVDYYGIEENLILKEFKKIDDLKKYLYGYYSENL